MSPDELPPDPGPAYELPELHRSTRMPLDAVVRLHFEGTVAYQNGFAANVSAKGMFVKHPDPPPVGARLVFEFVIGDQRKPVQGGGVVSWRREKYEGPGKAAGVGIEFTEMDALSKQHIAEALFEYLESQLGVELADHPEAERLVEAVPSATPIDLDAAPSPAGPLFESKPEELPAVDASSSPGLRFNVFEESSAASPIAPEGGSELFRPEVPPENLDFLDGYGQAKRRKGNPWIAAAIFVVVVGGGFVAWWFLLGPGSIAERPRPAAEAPAAAPAEPVRQPPLSPQPGPQGTLADEVGVAAPGAAGADTTPSFDAQIDARPAAESAAEEPADTTPSEASATAPEPEPPPSESVTAPAAAPVLAETTPVASRPARRVRQITWESVGGATVVHIEGDGGFAPGSYRWYGIGAPSPRVLLRLTGMAEAFGKTALAATTGELAGIRIGFHPAEGGSEVHVVLDLTSSRVQATSVEPRGNRLDVRLERR